MSKKHKENLKGSRKPSGIISLLTTGMSDAERKIFQKEAHSEHKPKKKETLPPGTNYDFGCSPTAGGIISGGLDRGGNYPSNDSED